MRDDQDPVFLIQANKKIERLSFYAWMIDCKNVYERASVHKVKSIVVLSADIHHYGKLTATDSQEKKQTARK